MPQTGGVNAPVEPAGVEEVGLVQRARSGDGQAFAALYDRYEHSVFNLCYRLTGSRDDAADATQEAFVAILERLPSFADRELNFPAYVLTCARHASYRAIESRRRAEPAGEASSVERDEPDPRDPGFLDEDPVRASLLSDQRHEVRRANAALPERQREVLALRELGELSYDEIAEVMEMNRNSVAQLIFRARIALRDALRAQAAASIPPADVDCERAMPLIAMHEDGELRDAADARWLDQHLGGCLACRVRREAAAEAGASYRAWAPIVPLIGLRDATIAKAAEHVGADWSTVAAGGRTGSSDGLDRAGSAPAGERSSGERHARHTPVGSLVTPLVVGVALFLALLALLLPGRLGDPSGGDPQVPARSFRSLESLLEAAKADRQARRERSEEDATGVSSGAAAGTAQGGSTGGAAAGTGQAQAGTGSADVSEGQGGEDQLPSEDAIEQEQACAPDQCPP